ncbi:UDP-galactose transporter [Vanrija pseudolonga]|uniref:UDP-galactose transporter n=1 Tax=Vanrija pseudolonga TaxID=143232 RepID=A0AAF1BHS3_9TREE|nr:UDP-galactose transporter [Vanrija pseudolonga]
MHAPRPRPFRRRSLTSLPSLPHPSAPTPPPRSPAMSVPPSRAMSFTSSPPTSPAQASTLPTIPTYEALTQPRSNIDRSGLGLGSSNSFARAPTIDEKGPRYIPPQVAAPQPPRDTSGPPKIFGIELKWVSLITLALQNAFLTIIMHYSRVSTPPERTYSAAAAVLLNELLKGSISILIALKKIDTTMNAEPASWQEKEATRTAVPGGLTVLHPSRLRALGRAIFSPDCPKLAIPAVLYVIQNNLQYVAASNLDVATFQVTYQMKILTTAFFSVVLLNKRLSRPKWAALFMLAMGVGIVQLQSVSVSGPSSHSATAAPVADDKALRSTIPTEHIERIMHPFRGFLAVTLACITSGLAGVYFELLLKSNSGSSPAPDLWVRNTQLSLFSLVPAFIPIIFAGAPEGMSWAEGVASKFANFNGWAWGTVLTQTFGGLITALVIRYSDNIMKGFATSLSIIISFLASVALFNYPITFSFVLGAGIVLAATYLYNAPNSLPDVAPRTSVAVAPGSPIPTSAPILGEPQPPSRTSSIINLLSLGGSRPGSRRTSATDLRAPQLTSRGSYNGSNPGTPFLLSAQNSYTNIADFSRSSPSPGPSRGWSPPGQKSKPTLTVDTGLATDHGR